MNTNNGKTGIIDIPAPLHSTGGDGDGQVGNVVAYAGDIWDDIIGKNQAEINATINNVSNLPLTSINGHVGSFKNIPKEDSNVVEADETIALGVGVFADKQRSFGWGSGYQVIFLTGSNSQYTIRMNGNSSAKQPFVALATAWVGGYILTSGTTHRRVAKVTAGNFSNGVLTITTNTDLGTLNDAKYTYECKTGQQNFCAGAFINSGRQNIAIGTSNFVTSDFSTTMGAMNGSTQNAKYSNTIGAWNNNDAKGTIVGNENTLKTENSSIVGTDNSITSNSDTPSSVLGYQNNIPSGHGALIGNDNTSSGDKGYALGEHNNLQYSGIALGQYNKDYTSNSDSEKNLFVVGNGTADNARSNSIEQKQDGNLFIKGVGGFDGTNSQSASTKSLQDVLNEIEEQIASASTSGGVSSWNDLEDKPTILDSYDVRQIVLEKSPLHYDDSNTNYVSYFPNGSNDAYTPNTVSGTSRSVLIGLYNGFRNTYNGVVLGNNNSTDGNKSRDGYDSTVIVGLKNTNNSRNSVLIGDYNNNNQNYSVMLGSSNINKSEGGINIGYYNQGNGGERNVMIGYDNTSSNSASTLCMGSENRLTWYSSNPANQEIIAIGRGLKCNTGGIFLGYYNVDDYVLTGDTANFLTIGDGSGTIYSSTPSNIIEQRRNGDIFIKGIGNYNGNNSRWEAANPYRGKSLQEVLSQLSTDIQSVSASTSGGSSSDSNLSLDEDKNLLVNEDYITVDGGYNLLYAIDYIGYNLSGSSSQYELELYGGYSWKDFHYQLVKFLEDAEILDEDGQTVAIITDATYDSSTKNITITTSVDLGELHGNMFYSRNLNIADCCICLGGFLNKGYYANLIGRDNYNTGDDAIAIGNYNTNEGEGCVIVGNSNSIQNEHKGYRCYVFGERNKVNDNSILYVLGQYNESTGDDLQSFGLGDGIKFTRGVNAGNDNLNQAGIGVGLDISQNEFVLGQFNKDYDIADNSQKNFFTVGNGNESTKSNILEQKANGDLYVLGLGGFNGANSNVNTTKSLQAKIAELEARIAQLEGGNS